MGEPSEFQILIIALVFAPLMAWTYRGMEMPGKRWLGFALLAVLAAYVLTIAEGYFPTPLSPDNPTLNTLEHVCYLIAAVCFAVSSTDFLKTHAWLEDGERR